ncbi:unnamed protein product, partial [Tuber aestivum]
TGYLYPSILYGTLTRACPAGVTLILFPFSKPSIKANFNLLDLPALAGNCLNDRMSQLSSLSSIKVGVDLGTTYSGVAWALTSTPDEINVIDRWVAKGGRTSAKAPSEIAYTPSGVKWGFGIPNEVPRLALFELLLDPTKYSLATSTNTPLAGTNHLIPPGKKLVDVVTDYLSELYKHTIKHLKGALGEDLVEFSPLDFTFIVPAVWSDAAKNLTLQAAENAGFGRKKSIRLISEPEAAAVCCLKEMQPNNLNVGDAFVVADCGSRTVNVISYTITRKAPKLEAVECVEGAGAMCGSAVLNECFEKLRSYWHQASTRAFSWVMWITELPRFDKMSHRARVYMVKEFDDCLKRNFTDSDEEDIFTCRIPGVADDSEAGIKDGMFVIDREEMREIFDPTVEEIVELVQKQVDEVEKLVAITPLPDEGLYPDAFSSIIFPRGRRRAKSLVLIGGFGESEYLRSRLQAEIRTNDDRKISILQPSMAWSAAVRGAVMCGLEGEMVRVRKVTSSYGYSCSVPFIEGIHPKIDGYIDPHDGECMCMRRMHWFIRKGEDVEDNNPIRHTFYICRSSLDELNDRITVPLLATDHPVSHPNRISWRYPLILAHLVDIYPYCTLEVDLSVIPEKFKRKIGINDQFYFRLGFDLLISIQSASMLFQFDIDGTVYSDVKACYH